MSHDKAKYKIEFDICWVPYTLQHGLLIEPEGPYHMEKFPRTFKSPEDFADFMKNDPTWDDFDGVFILVPIITRRTVRA